MKKTSNRRGSKAGGQADMRREYHFDYHNARPNRFARLMRETTVTVTLDPDVASVFQTSKAVKSLLRSVISAFPERSRSQSKSA